MRYVSDHDVVASRGSYGALDCNPGSLPSRTWSKNERPIPGESRQGLGGANRSRSHVDIATPDPESPWRISIVSSNWRAVAIVCVLVIGVVFLLLAFSVYLRSTASTTTALQHPRRNNTMDIIAGREEPSETVGVAQEDQVKLSVEATDARLPALSFTALNFYHLRDGKPGKDYPWLRGIKLVEPHRNTTFTVTNARAGFRYRWKVRAGISAWAEDVLMTAFGAETDMVLTRLGKNIITLQELDSSGLAVRHLEEIVMVKYVRREIRTLTDDDREELLDAMFTLWKVRAGGDGGGRGVFGKDYTDIWAITNLHFSAASKGMCDHIHDGLGFLTSHTQMSNTFEYSLQLVNPKVTLPYWDFTIETSQEFKRQEGGVDPMEPQKQSPLFKPSWFGGIDSSDHQVKDGRWAYLEIPKIKENNGDIFQRLRSPWNVNQRPYLTRAMGQMCGVRIEPTSPWPTCGSHYKLLTKHSDFYDWVWDAQYDPHGPVHIWIGGLLDCEETYGNMAELVGTKIAHKLAMLSFIHRKSLYRDGVFKCNSTAVSDHEILRMNDTSSSIHPQKAAENSTSRCGCLDYDLSQGDDYLFILDLLVFTEDALESLDADTKRKVIGMICNAPIAEGDHLQASSPMDPTFWPIHPTMERLWMFKRMTGTMTALTWPDHDVDDKIVSVYSDSCIGHRGSDVFPFGLLNNLSSITIRSGIHYHPRESGSGNRSGLSNREVLEALDPRIDTLPYVYDNFEWSHCEAEGLNFDDAYFSGFNAAYTSMDPVLLRHGPPSVRRDVIQQQQP